MVTGSRRGILGVLGAILTQGNNIVATLYVLRGPDKGRVFQTPSEPAILGRQSDHIPLTDNTTSREHAKLKPDGANWVIEDLNSSNGTYVNGQRIEATVKLRHGDQIKIGSTLLVFSGGESVERFSGTTMTRNMIEYSSTGEPCGRMDSSILAAIPSCEDSVILAAPETADAVHAWKLMYQIAEAIGMFHSVTDFIERVADLICEHFVFDRVLVFMGNPEDDEFMPQVIRRRSQETRGLPRITASRTLINHVRESKNGILCADVGSDQRFVREDGGANSVQGLGLRSVLCVPIIAHDEVHGIIQIGCAMAQHTYTQEQLRLATAIGRMAGMAIENARLLESRVHTERLAAMGETVAHLSHHIRNILQGLHSGSDVLELGIKQKNFDTILSAWRIIQRNLDRTLHLATNMLTFSKDHQPVIETGHLNKLVEDAVGLAQHCADDKGVTLLSEFSDIYPVPLDKEGLHQAVLNLVRNAIEACPDTGGHVVVSTTCRLDDSIAIISVTDNGPGIEEEELSHIFEPFHSTKGHGGTGLGLAAARKIVRECHGELDVQSRPDTGTTFTITIPVQQTQIINSEETVTS